MHGNCIWQFNVDACTKFIPFIFCRFLLWYQSIIFWYKLISTYSGISLLRTNFLSAHLSVANTIIGNQMPILYWYLPLYSRDLFIADTLFREPMVSATERFHCIPFRICPRFSSPFFAHMKILIIRTIVIFLHSLKFPPYFRES